MEGMLHTQGLQANSSSMGMSRAHVKSWLKGAVLCSALKVAYLASRLPLGSSADALPRKLTVESSYRHIHRSFLSEIEVLLKVLFDARKVENPLHLFSWSWPHNARGLVNGICSFQGNYSYDCSLPSFLSTLGQDFRQH